MKITIKLLGIISLLAVIGFSMAACGSDDGGSDDGSDKPIVFANTTWKATVAHENHIYSIFTFTFGTDTWALLEQIDENNYETKTWMSGPSYTVWGNTAKLLIAGTKPSWITVRIEGNTLIWDGFAIGIHDGNGGEILIYPIFIKV